MQNAGQTAVNELVDTLTFGGTITGGTFTLSFNGQVTAPILWNANAASLEQNIQSALNALTAPGSGSPVVSAPTGTGIYVQPNLAGLQSSAVIVLGTIDDNADVFLDGADLPLTGSGQIDLGGSNTYRGTTTVNSGMVLTVSNDQSLGGTAILDTQQITVANPLANKTTFTLTFNGQMTDPVTLTGNDTTDAATIASALNDLTNIGDATNPDSTVGGFVIVDGTTTGTTTVFTVMFTGSMAGFDQPQMTATITSPAGTGTVAVATTQDGAGATIIANGASLQLQGSVTVAGEPLEVEGQGINTAPNAPQQWFSVGPSTITNGETAGNGNVTGSITSIAVDPTDPNTIYIGTAGGGAWKTINGGETWQPLFDGIPEVQQITIANGVKTFTLSLGTATGDTTPTLALTGTTNDAITIQNAINGLASVAGVGGFATVSEVSSGVFNVTFSGGTLNGASVTAMTGTVITGTGTVGVTTTTNAVGSAVALFTGAITFGANPNTIFLGTGDTDNAPDSFYGTGVYESQNAGQTWSLVTGAGTVDGGQTTAVNPFYGKGISQMVFDPNSGNLYVADGDGGTGKNEIQQLDIDLGQDDFTGYKFKIFFNDGTVTDETAPISWTNTGNMAADEAANALAIQNAINALPDVQTFEGAGGAVVVTPPPQPPSGNITNIPGAVGSPIVIDTPSTAGLANGDQVTISGVTGDTNANTGRGTWTVANLTATSFEIETGGFRGQQPVDSNAPYTGGGTWTEQERNFNNNNYTVTFSGGTLQFTGFPLLTTTLPMPMMEQFPPTIGVSEIVAGGPLTVVNGEGGSPGIYSIQPVRSGTDWFDLTNVVSSNRSSVASDNPADPQFGPPNSTTPGTFPNTPGPDDNYQISFPQTDATWSSLVLTVDSDGKTTLVAALGSASGNDNNGVFWTDTQDQQDGVIWDVGDPNYDATFNDPSGLSNPPFPLVPGVDNESPKEFPTPNGDGAAENATIKLADNNGSGTVYAAVADPSGTLLNIFAGNFNNFNGLDWGAVGSLPSPSPFSGNGGQGKGGNYDNAIAVDSSGDIFVGGQVTDFSSEAGQIYESTDGGNTWTDLSVDGSGNGPHTEQHAIAFDSSGNVYVGGDGGIWQYDGTNWNDLNNNLDIAQINSVATNPTSASDILAGSQMNGIDSYTGNQTWNEVVNLDNFATYATLSGGEVQFNPQNANIVYAVANLPSNTLLSGLYESTDGGLTWGSGTFDGPILTIPFTPVAGQTSTVFPFALDQVNPSRLVVGGVFPGTVLQQSLDGGATWVNIGKNLANGGAAVRRHGHGQHHGTCLGRIPGHVRGRSLFPGCRGPREQHLRPQHRLRHGRDQHRRHQG